MAIRIVRVYTFKGQQKGVKFSIPHVTLKDAKARIKSKWGKEPILSSGKVNKKLTKIYNKMVTTLVR